MYAPVEVFSAKPPYVPVTAPLMLVGMEYVTVPVKPALTAEPVQCKNQNLQQGR